MTTVAIEVDNILWQQDANVSGPNEWTSKITAMDDNTPLVLDVKSFEDVKAVINIYTEHTLSAWSVYTTRCQIGTSVADQLSNLEVLKKKRIIFSVHSSNKSSDNPRAQMDLGLMDHPIMTMGDMTYQCHQGPDKDKVTKEKRAQKKKERGYPIKTHIFSEPTKKVGCPSCIYVRRTILFPLYKIPNLYELEHVSQIRTAKKNMIEALRRDLIAKKKVYYEEVFRILLPCKSSHKFHAVDDRFRCEFCSQNCRNRTRLLRHRRQQHSDQTARKAKPVTCVMCKTARFATVSGLIGHVNAQHGKNHRVESFEARSMHDYLSWKSNLEKSFRTRFVLKLQGKATRTHKTQYFQCNRSAKCGVKSARRKAAAACGQINGTCTAFLTVKFPLANTDSIKVKYCVGHFGHALPMRKYQNENYDQVYLETVADETMRAVDAMNTSLGLTASSLVSERGAFPLTGNAELDRAKRQLFDKSEQLLRCEYSSAALQAVEMANRHLDESLAMSNGFREGKRQTADEGPFRRRVTHQYGDEF